MSKSPSIFPVYSNEMKLIKVCNSIQKHGVMIDRGYIEAGLNYEYGQIEKARKSFETDTGRTYKNSSKLFAEIFTERKEAFPRTAKGNPSFTAEFLDSSGSATTQLISRIRHHEKRVSTYWTSFLYFAGPDNVLHAYLNQAGTVTGRFSSSNPNLQNLPAEDSPDDRNSEFLIRRSFVPRPGYKFYSIDYSQQEFKLMLDYAGEHALIEAINGGKDVHTATADYLGIPRNHAKTVSFALLYGTGIDKLSRMLGVSTDEARRIKKHYFSQLPNVKKLINNIVKIGENRGYIYNWLGRRYWCSNFDFSYILPNHLIQGGGADIIKKAMTLIHEEDPESGMCLQVHDELVFELPDDSKIPRFVEIMNSVYTPKNGLGMSVNVSVSDKSLAKLDMTKI